MPNQSGSADGGRDTTHRRLIPERDVALVTYARFLSAAGAQAAFVVGIWGKAAFEFEATPGGIAILMLGLGAAWFVGSAAGGILVDRFGPRRVFVAAEVLISAGALTLIAASSLGQLVILASVVELFIAAAYNAAVSAPPFLVTGIQPLRRVNVTLETADRLAAIVGAGAGALVARLTGVDWIFGFHAAAALAAALLFHVAKLTESAQPSSRLRLTDGVRFTYRHRSVRYYVLLGAMLWMSFSAFETLAPVFFRDVLGTGPDALGWISMVFGMGLALGSLALMRFPPTLVSATGLAAIIAASGLASLAYVGTKSLEVVVVGAVLWGFALGFEAPVLRVLFHSVVPRRILGRVISTAEIHDEIASLIPLAFVPALAAAFGVQAVLIANGILLAALALSTMPYALWLDRGTGGPEKASPAGDPPRGLSAE